MRVGDLQLGDWVSCLGDPVRVMSLSLNDDEPIGIMSPLKKIFTFREEDVYPIPLTAEILLKNGWTYYKYYFIFENADWRLKVELIEDDLFLLSFDEVEEKIGEHKMYMSRINDLALCSVHELQHALRLAGLSELADNLKI